MGMHLPCIICTSPTQFPPPIPYSAELRDKEEKTFVFLCELLKLQKPHPQFQPFPICPTCRRFYEKLSSLQEQLAKVQEATKILTQIIKKKVEDTAELDRGDVYPQDEQLSKFIKGFRDCVISADQRAEVAHVVDMNNVVLVVDNNQQPQEIQVQPYTVEVVYEEGDGITMPVVEENEASAGGQEIEKYAGNYSDESYEEVRPPSLDSPLGSPRRRNDKRSLSPSSRSPSKKRAKKQFKTTRPNPKTTQAKFLQNLPFKCPKPNCSLSYLTIYRLQSHIKRHANKVTYKCYQCNMQFSSTSKLKSHNAEIHQIDKPYNCSDCKKSFIQASALKYHSSKHIKTLSCSVCKNLFRSGAILKRHMQVHNTNSADYGTDNRCCYCTKLFTRKDDLMDHMTRIHRGEVSGGQCYICDKLCDTAIELITHIYLHSKNAVCVACNQSFEGLNELRGHNQGIHGIEREHFSCSSCGILFYSQKAFSFHQKLHIPFTTKQKTPQSSTITCGTCMEKFASLKDLKMHQRIQHNTNRWASMKCTRCEKCFQNAESLQFHMDHHPAPGEDQNICKLCEKVQKFKSFASFKRHVLSIHQTKEKLQCTECNYSTRRRDDLIGHHRRMHGERSEKKDGQPIPKKTRKVKNTTEEDVQTTCEVCKKVFKNANSYKRHFKYSHNTNTDNMHTVLYQCEHCDKTCKRREDLIKHLVIHDESRKKIIKTDCDICWKKFKTNAILKRHIKDSHEDHGRFVCDYCNRGFKRKDDAYKHISLIHKGFEEEGHVEFVKKQEDNSNSNNNNKSKNTQDGDKLVVDIKESIDKLKCQYCGKYLASIGFLKEHLVQHTGIPTANPGRSKRRKTATPKCKQEQNMNKIAHIVDDDDDDDVSIVKFEVTLSSDSEVSS